MARKFFHVCAGMLMLAIAYHLGASTARAGLDEPIDGAAVSVFNPTAAIGRTFYIGTSGIPVPVPIPGTSRVIATDAGNQGLVLLENGDTYNWQGENNGWVFIGNLFGAGPTPALHESWGQLKSRYRATPPATPGVTATPGASNK